MVRRAASPVALLILAAGLGLAITPSMAQEAVAEPAGQHDPGLQPEEHGDPEGAEEAGVVLPRNAVGLVIGVTYESEEEKSFSTLGLEYARELTHRWAWNVVAEHLSDIDAWVFVSPFTYRPGRLHPHASSHFLLTFGPGIEHKSRRVRRIESGEHAGEYEVEQDENLFLFRAGIRYPVHIGKRYVMAPAIDFDFVRENGEWVEAVVFDVALGFTF